MILSVGYGEGHHAAAHAMREEWESRGWRCRVEDVCQKATPKAFRLTQRFYQFCVRRLPWLWGVTYAQTETPDWAETLRFPLVSQSLKYLTSLLESETPDIVICTYPLFAYMLDALKAKGKLSVPYVVIVTDALEISRPWMRTNAPLVCVPDALSRKLVLDRYGLPEQRVVAAGFPVKRAFADNPTRDIPNENDFKIIYGAYAPTRRVCRDVRSILSGIPGSSITLIAGARQNRLLQYLVPEQQTGRLHIIERTDAMHRLFLDSHLYIGKAGAATMFEAYAAGIPVVVNYALPGQEQGNLNLLLSDGAGIYVESTQDLLSELHALLVNGSAAWLRMQADMKRAARGGAAPRIADDIERRFFS